MIDYEARVRTMEGFIRQLVENGYPKYASELRHIIAMYRKRKNAETALISMTSTLLIHLVKYIAMPHSRNRNKWLREIRGYLLNFDIRNQNSKKRPWLPIEYIKKDMNDMLAGPKFLPALEHELQGYSTQEIESVRSLPSIKNIKSLGIKVFYDPDNSLNICVEGIPVRHAVSPTA